MAHFMGNIGQFITSEILGYAEVEAFEFAPQTTMGVPYLPSATVLSDGGEKASWMLVTEGIFDLAAKKISPTRAIDLNILNFVVKVVIPDGNEAIF